MELSVEQKFLSGEYDYITGEYIGEPVGYPRTNGAIPKNFTSDAMNCIASIARSRGYNNTKRSNLVESFIYSKGIPIVPKYFYQCEIIVQLYKEEFKTELDRYKTLEAYLKEERKKEVKVLLKRMKANK